MANLSDLINEAYETDSQRFLSLVTRVGRILSAETGSGKPRITGRMVHVPPSGEATMIGDIHGDLNSLQHILDEADFQEKASGDQEVYLVFLGDYGDRGAHSAEVYHIVLSLKNMYPSKVILLQGNHEGPEDLLAHPHDLPYHLQAKFGADWRPVYMELSRLFRRFQTAAIVEGKCILLHAGVPSRAKSLEDVAYAYEKHPAESHLEEILWSDPVEGITGTQPSPRGAGNLFGQDVTDAFLKMLGVRFVVRGHEPVSDGCRFDHGGKVLTIFSRRGSPYLNRYGAYLTFDLSETYQSALELASSVRRF